MSSPRVARPGQTNGDPLDRFTAGHAAVGVLLGLGRMPWWVALLTAVGWEAIENPIKARFPRAFPHASFDRPANAIMDIVAMMTGWAAMRALPPKP